MTLCTLSHPALSVYFFHKFFPPLIHFFAPDCLHGLLSWLFRLSNSVLKSFFLYFGTVHYRSNWIFVSYWARINIISSRFVVHCFAAWKTNMFPAVYNITGTSDCICNTSRWYCLWILSWRSTKMRLVSKIIEIGSFLTELWMNEWKCEDFKCVWKPTESRLCLTHYVNKSSRWAK